MAGFIPSLDLKGGSSESSASTTGTSGATGAGTKQSVFINLAASGSELAATADTGGSLSPTAGNDQTWLWLAAAAVGLFLLFLSRRRRP